MKARTILAAAWIMGAAVALADIPPKWVEVDVQGQQLQRLTDLAIQQGANVELRIRPKTQGNYLSTTGLTARWEARANMTTSAAYQATSDLSTTSTPYYIRIPLTTVQTGSALTNYIYSIVLLSGGNQYPLGTGSWNVVASGFAGASSIQTSTVAATTIQLDAEIAARIAGDAGLSNLIHSATGALSIAAGSWTAGTGLTNLGSATSATGALSQASIASLARADLAITSNSVGGVAIGATTFATGTNSFAHGRGNTATGEASHAGGTDSIASGDYSHGEGYSVNATATAAVAAGFNANSSNASAYAWQGSAGAFTENAYGSHGPGTFNINPVGGASGFWIGQTNLQTLIGAGGSGATPTLQDVVNAGGAVTSGVVTIDSANARTNTYGGALGIGPNRWQANAGAASGSGSWANGGVASGDYSWAGVNSVASGDRSWANGGGAASGARSWAMGQSAIASNDNSFAWNDQYSHGDGSFNIGAPSLLWLQNTNLQTLLDAKLSTESDPVWTNALAQGFATPGSITMDTGTRSSTSTTFAANEFITRDGVDEMLALLSGFTFYGATNAAPAPYTPYLQFSTAAVEAWTNSYTLTNGVEQLVGSRLWTGAITRLQSGTYVHHVNANYSVVNPTAGTVAYRSDLVLFDGVTTVVVGAGGSAQVGTAVEELGSSVALTSNITCTSSQRVGVLRYATFTRTAGSGTAALNIYGGTGHGATPATRNTRLEGPSLTTSSSESDPIFEAARSTFVTNGGATINGAPLTNGAAITITAGTSTSDVQNISWNSQRVPTQITSASTVTVLAAWGNLMRLDVTNASVVIVAEAAVTNTAYTYDATLELFAGTNTIAWVTGIYTNTTLLDISTTGVTVLNMNKPQRNQLVNVRQ